MTLDQQQLLESDFVEFGYSTQQQLAQAFQPSVTKPIARFEVSLSKNGSPTDNVQLGIYADNGGVPGALLGFADNQIAGSGLLIGFGNPTICDFDFAVGPVLTAGTTYWAILSRTGSLTGVNDYMIFTSDDNPDPYTRGDMYFYNGSTWALVGPFSGFYYNFTFKEYYGPLPLPAVVSTVPSPSFRFIDQVTAY